MKIFIYILLICLLSCNNSHPKSGVELAMKQYDRLIKKMDGDSIALLYTPDGNPGGIVRGRDSIRAFLSSFKNLKVLSQASTTTFLQLNGDSAIQKGTYQQIALVPAKDTIKVKGEYVAHWLWITPDGWHIKEMTTKPTN